MWNQTDYRAYQDQVPRFCSEFGFQGPPTWATLTDWVHDAWYVVCGDHAQRVAGALSQA